MLRTITLLTLLACAPFSLGCTIVATNLQMCSSTGVVGPWTYTSQNNFVLLNWTVTGTPAAPYNIKFTFGGAAPLSLGPFSGAGGFAAICGTSYPTLLGTPVTVVIDPTNVSGNTTPATATLSKTFTPTLPTAPIVYYAPTILFGAQTMTVPVSAGSVAKLVMLLGRPTTDTFQSVATDTSTGSLLSSTPANYPVFEKVQTNVGAGSYSLTQSFKVTVSNVAINPNLIHTTWAQIDSDKATLPQYYNPEGQVESTNASIVAFTNANLPINFRATLTPLQVAEKLFAAVVKAITYQTPANGDAVVVLTNKVGDCGGMTNLYNACLRAAGIPCRTVCGWATDSTTHCWGEILFPGTGWVPEDTSFSRLTSSTCIGMPFFGYLPTANQHCSVCRTGTIVTPNITTNAVQVGAFTVAAGAPAPAVGTMTWSVALSPNPLP